MTAGPRLIVLILLFAGNLLPNAAASVIAEQTSNVRLVESFPYETTDRPTMDVGGTDLAFEGSHIYAAEQGREGAGGGVHIYKATGGGARKLAFLKCGGWQNDVAIVAKGLIALGYHKGAVNCGSKNGGVTLVDVANPRRPQILGSTPESLFASDESFGGVHTITTFPRSPYVFASPGGTFTQGTNTVTVIDVSDPLQPVEAARIDTGLGCHDLTFSIQPEYTLGFCSGVGTTQVWDMADPLSPKVLASIVNPLHAFHHSNAVTADGSLLVIGTETLGNDCLGGPTGALVAYDITDPAVPVFKGFFGAPRGRSPVYPGVMDMNFESLCAAHLFNFKDDTRTLVSGNGSGGISVVDFSDPSRPTEVAHYMSADMPMVFAAYWHRGRVYANGLSSLDVFEIKL